MNPSTCDIDSYVAINKHILRLVGLYPINLTRHFIAIFLIVLFFLIPITLNVPMRSYNYDEILETSLILVPFSVILKSFIWCHHSETESLMNYFFNDYWRIAISSNNSKYLYEVAKKAKLLTAVYAGGVVITSCWFYCLPLLPKIVAIFEDGRNEPITDFPFVAIYPQFCHGPPFFGIVYISQILATLFCGLVSVGFDTILITMILHSSGHFAILHEEIYMHNFRSDVKFDWPDRHIAEIIEHHQAIVRFLQRMESLFNAIILIQVLLSTAIICITSARINSSSVLTEAVYCSNWYEGPYRVWTDLSFIIMRAQKANCLSIGKFSALHMQKFVGILNMSLSYFMLLRTFRQ